MRQIEVYKFSEKLPEIDDVIFVPLQDGLIGTFKVSDDLGFWINEFEEEYDLTEKDYIKTEYIDRINSGELEKWGLESMYEDIEEQWEDVNGHEVLKNDLEWFKI